MIIIIIQEFRKTVENTIMKNISPQKCIFEYYTRTNETFEAYIHNIFINAYYNGLTKSSCFLSFCHGDLQ